MKGSSLGRLAGAAVVGLIVVVLVPMVFITALLGASSAASCGTASAAVGPVGDLNKSDPEDMPPLEIARRIYAVGARMKMDDRQVLTAFAVVIVETGGNVTMKNTRGGTGSSTGAFQQIDDPHYTKRNRDNVSAAATTFFEDLRAVDHGQPVGKLAQDVQHSGYGSKYALVVGRAKWFLTKIKGAPAAGGEGLGSITAPGSACGGAAAPVGPPGKIGKNNDLVPPADAPPKVVQVILAANQINDTPYVWGGGHAGYGLVDGYDCSGSVSYALHGGGFMPGPPLVSGDFGSWGSSGKGKWITVYSSSIHVFMFVAGVRFDTSPWGDTAGSGPRWRSTPRSLAGFTVTHPQGY
jgi:cell wall-associated NlpC family hydrolase